MGHPMLDGVWPSCLGARTHGPHLFASLAASGDAATNVWFQAYEPTAELIARCGLGSWAKINLPNFAKQSFRAFSALVSSLRANSSRSIAILAL